MTNMSTSTSLTTREPVLTAGTIVAVVGSIITLLVAFGVDLTKDQLVALAGFVAVVAPIVATVLARRKASPTSSIVAKLDTKTGEVVAGDASPLPSGLILEPGQTVESITP